MKRWCIVALACCWLLVGSRRARALDAEIARFAVVIGNDIGNDIGPGRDVPLRYAESDAARMAEVLERVGGFDAAHVATLRGRDADAVLRALIAVNAQIRTQAAGRDSVLFVYYSGHGDRNALHLGNSRLELTALEQLVRGSAATVRLLVLDSCHSGALTRVKGGRVAPRMSIEVTEHLRGEGLVFLTSSSASEEAQESDELGGSFFTHYFTSGLLGAADQNEDGVVVLKEAYRHAYENTVRASSRTEAGTQHPTFRYELGGQGDLVLSRLVAGPDSGSVRFPGGVSFMLLRNGADGPVVLELGANDRSRTLHVKPGQYLVRGRGPDYLVEGALDVPPARLVEVAIDELDRVDYARMVRRGGDEERWTHGPTVGYRLRSAIARGGSPCHGPFAGYLRESPALRWAARIGACRGSFANSELSADTDELSLSGRVAHAWDTRLVSFDLGAELGLAWLRQSFESEGRVPPRNTLAPELGIDGSVIVYLPDGFHIAAEVGGVGYAFQVESAQREQELSVRFAARGGVVLGWEFAGF